MSAQSFGQWLKAQRSTRGLTQQELADLLGVRQQVVQRWETEKNDPRAPMKRQIAGALGVSLDTLPGLAPVDGYRPDPDRPATVYALCEPDTGIVRYVGVTTIDPHLRLNQHVGSAQPHDRLSPRERWIVELKAQGQRPTLRILERVPLERRRAAEEYWCAQYAETLTNSAPAGALGRPSGLAQTHVQGSILTATLPERAGQLTIERGGAAIILTLQRGARHEVWQLDRATLNTFLNTEN